MSHMSLNLAEYLVVLSSPRSVPSEAFRTIRTNLQASMGEELKSIAMVSSWGSEGKSLVCANLAAAFAQLFFEVILVDGDLRRPTLSRLFNCETNPGLAEHLHRDPEAQSLEALTIKTDVRNLSFLPAGQVRGNPADLLAGPGLGKALQSFTEKDYFVVIDTPPISACSDSIMIGSKVSGVVMVVNPTRWRGDVEVKLKESLLNYNVNILGVVLNGVDQKEAIYGYGDKNAYAYGYGYGENVREESGSKSILPWAKWFS